MEKTKAYAQKPVITPLTLVLLVIRIAIDIAESITWYEMSGKIAVSISLILSGAKLTDVKEILLRMKTVLQNKDLTLTQKFEQIFNIVITGCATLGVIQEEMNVYPNEYFVRKIEKPDDSTNAIAQ